MKKQHITILFFLLVCLANAQNNKNDTIIKDGKLYNLKKKEIKDPLGKTYVNLTFNN